MPVKPSLRRQTASATAWREIDKAGEDVCGPAIVPLRRRAYGDYDDSKIPARSAWRLSRSRTGTSVRRRKRNACVSRSPLPWAMAAACVQRLRPAGVLLQSPHAGSSAGAFRKRWKRVFHNTRRPVPASDPRPMAISLESESRDHPNLFNLPFLAAADPPPQRPTSTPLRVHAGIRKCYRGDAAAASVSGTLASRSSSSRLRSTPQR